jgi:hypothetical protein
MDVMDVIIICIQIIITALANEHDSAIDKRIPHDPT